MDKLSVLLGVLLALSFGLHLVQACVLKTERRWRRQQRGRVIDWSDLPCDVSYEFLGQVSGKAFIVPKGHQSHDVIGVVGWQGDFPDEGDTFMKKFRQTYETERVSRFTVTQDAA